MSSEELASADPPPSQVEEDQPEDESEKQVRNAAGRLSFNNISKLSKKYVITQAFLDHYDETRKRAEWKLELRKSNRDTTPLEEDALHRLDSSLKKNTAFVRKIRQSFNADSAAGLTKDAKSLNLTKYMGEVRYVSLNEKWYS